MVAVEIRAKVEPNSSINTKSIIIASVAPVESKINVRRPAACLLLERSIPTTAENTIDKINLNKILQIFKSKDQLPNKFAIGSCILIHLYFLLMNPYLRSATYSSAASVN